MRCQSYLLRHWTQAVGVCGQIFELSERMKMKVLYHFELFGRHASQPPWTWPKSNVCPRSRQVWPG